VLTFFNDHRLRSVGETITFDGNDHIQVPFNDHRLRSVGETTGGKLPKDYSHLSMITGSVVSVKRYIRSRFSLLLCFQ